MRVIVTGHEGYIGAVLVPRLLARGHTVVGLDSGYFAGCTFVAGSAEVPTLRKDLRDVEPTDFEGVDALIHLGALSNDPLAELNERLTREINGDGSVLVARVAKKAGVRRFLFSSSCSVYGIGNDAPRTEDDDLAPQTEYARSKIASERAIAELADQRFSPTFLRNATAYGMSPKFRFDLVVNNLVGWAVTTGEIKILSDGTPWRPLAHTEDLSDAFIAILEAETEAVHNQVFNVGQNAENYQVRDIADAVGRLIPGCNVTYNENAGPDTRSYRVNFSKLARRVPAFKPRWSVERGIEQLRDAFRARGLMPEDFQGPRFIRLKHLQELVSNHALDADLRWTAKRADDRVAAGGRR